MYKAIWVVTRLANTSSLARADIASHNSVFMTRKDIPVERTVRTSLICLMQIPQGLEDVMVDTNVLFRC